MAGSGHPETTGASQPWRGHASGLTKGEGVSDWRVYHSAMEAQGSEMCPPAQPAGFEPARDFPTSCLISARSLHT